MASFSALYDACVLYPAPLRDLLVSLAGTDLFRARWTDAIHEEWINHLLNNRPDLTREQLERTRTLMDTAVIDCLIRDYEGLIEGCTLPDPDDRHVLAAAIRGRVDVIVTYNTKDFPPESCSKYGIRVQHPDEFINHLLHLNDSKVMSTIKAMRSRLRKPAISAKELLDTFEQANLVQAASYLRKYEDLI